ncbi:MAG: prolyl oligopeptidase family serine peptidase [Ignavibacteriaceae bacterium]|nr:prolyl oligopeptidase family serine peptidase [Ignavibacteriaceae bacterium]
MHTNFINREKIKIKEAQVKLLTSGWGIESYENSIVEKITYNSDELKVKGYLAYPKNMEMNKKYPCVIWCRGGIGDQGAIDAFNARGIFGQLASWGYVVFAPQYRGNGSGEGKDEFGGGDIDDVLNLMPLADELQFADTHNWGIEGWSRGGMMTYLTLTRTNKFKCAITAGGIANLHCNAEESKFMKRLYKMSMGEYETNDFKKKCESRSIVNFPEKLSESTPLLIMHGTDDNRVLPHDSLDLAYKLQNLNRTYRLVMLEGGDHFLRKHRREVDELRKMWFEKYLK